MGFHLFRWIRHKAHRASRRIKKTFHKIKHKVKKIIHKDGFQHGHRHHKHGQSIPKGRPGSISRGLKTELRKAVGKTTLRKPVGKIHYRTHYNMTKDKPIQTCKEEPKLGKVKTGFEVLQERKQEFLGKVKLDKPLEQLSKVEQDNLEKKFLMTYYMNKPHETHKTFQPFDKKYTGNMNIKSLGSYFNKVGKGFMNKFKY